MSTETATKPGRHAEGVRTRERVLGAASRLIAAHGYAGTSISAISKASSTNPASIYWAFGSKEGLLSAVMERAADEFFEEPAIQSEGAPWEIAERWADLFRDGPAFLRLLLLLSLERRDGDPTALEAARRVRGRARLGLAEAYAAEIRLDDEIAGRRIGDSMARLTLMLLDGLFVTGQIEPDEGSVEERLSVIATSLRATTEALVTAAGGTMK